jgi:hypothetical protein
MTLYVKTCLGFLLFSRINPQLFFGAKNIPERFCREETGRYFRSGNYSSYCYGYVMVN